MKEPSHVANKHDRARGGHYDRRLRARQHGGLGGADRCRADLRGRHGAAGMVSALLLSALLLSALLSSPLVASSSPPPLVVVTRIAGGRGSGCPRPHPGGPAVLKNLTG